MKEPMRMIVMKTTALLLVLLATLGSCAVPKQGVRTLVDLVLEVCEDEQEPNEADIADCFQRVKQARETTQTTPMVIDQER